jgi:outer membrane protein assembly factor BamB
MASVGLGTLLTLTLALHPQRSAGAAVTDPTAFTVYHYDPAGSGDVGGISAIDTSHRAWTSPALDGQLFVEPLADDGRVFVATENDTVYALSAASGRVLWSRHLATAVPAGDLPCGNISPTVGITGTPVIDAKRDELFVVADELSNARPRHVLYGVSLATGAVLLSEPVDPPGDDPAALLQRTGLTLDDGRVVFGFGGNYGDCGNYHGWVMAVPEAGGEADRFEVDAARGEREGAVWMGGAAPVIGSDGDVYVEAGNGSVRSAGEPYDDSDSVLELTPAMRLVQYFAPANWASENAADADMATSPALLPGGRIVASGKDQHVYLLDATHLGGIGGQLATMDSPCGNDLDGGMAVAGNVVYLPCLTGTEAVSAAGADLHLLWAATHGGGPALLAAGLVWSIGGDGVLYGLRPADGRLVQQAEIGAIANHFRTPSVGDGLLLAAGSDFVVAWPAHESSAGGSTTTTRPPATTTSSGSTAGGTTSSLPAPNSTRGGGSGRRKSSVPLWLTAIVVLVGVSAGGAAAWWRSRRRGSPPGSPDGPHDRAP